MKILVTGGCGFVGSSIALFLKKKNHTFKISTLDNLIRKGSSVNLKRLKKVGIKNYNIEIENYKKFAKLEKFDFIIDCCAEPSVEISRKEIDKVFNTNLVGTFNVLKKCIKDNAGLIFLSSSRVYSLKALNNYKKLLGKKLSDMKTVNENFSTQSPKTIYGFTKLASEEIIREFSYLFRLKFIINRFGVISGPWQFGKQDQGFCSLWLWSYINGKSLKYIGYGGTGKQIRDILHIDDVCNLINIQIKNFTNKNNMLFNLGGGKKNAISLKELSKKCQKLTRRNIKIFKQKNTSIYDIPYYVSNNQKAKKVYNWYPKKNINEVLLDMFNWMKKNNSKIKKYF